MDALSAEVRELLEKAKEDDVTAPFRLANAYDFGRGAPRDGKEAMRWYAAAAEQGDALAQNSVGSGLQAENRYLEASVWYEKTVSQAHALATNNLAYFYDLGLGINQDRVQAFKLHSQAAELGWVEAMWNIADMYGAGQVGKTQDLVLRCVWTLGAGKFARPEEHQLLTQVNRVTRMLERRLSSAQRESCREQVHTWPPPRESSRVNKSRTVVMQ